MGSREPVIGNEREASMDVVLRAGSVDNVANATPFVDSGFSRSETKKDKAGNWEGRRIRASEHEVNGSTRSARAENAMSLEFLRCSMPTWYDPTCNISDKFSGEPGWG